MSDENESLSDLERLALEASSDADFEHLERLLNARENHETTTEGQKATLDNLTQSAGAHLLGCTTRHLRDHQPARNPGGTYNGPDLVTWFVDRQVGQAKKKWENSSESLKSAAERQAEARATKLEEEAKAVKDTYVLKADVLLEFQEMASAARAELEAIPKSISNDFPEEHREALVLELRNYIKQVLRRLAARGSKFDEAES